MVIHTQEIKMTVRYKPERERKEKRFSIRMTEEEQARIKAVAWESGMTFPEFVREGAREKMEREKKVSA